VAEAAADRAAAVIRPLFRSALLVEAKGDASPVTRADREAEEAIRALLAEAMPDHGVIGEEHGSERPDAEWVWVLDPIDGTRGYLSGTPTWGVLISVRDAGGPIYGIIDQPYIRERFEGGLGRAMVTGPSGVAVLKARGARPLAEAIVFSTFPEVGTAEEGAAFRRVASQARLVRYGTDCYGYALIAAGMIDLVIEAGLQAYDVQAPIAVIEAAGGVVTDWEGRPCLDGGRVLAAANATIHAEALALLRG
jgi:myo-inositol-1(or 4)-monophosphatase